VPAVHVGGRDHEEAKVGPRERRSERFRESPAVHHAPPGSQHRVQVVHHEQDLGVRARLLKRGGEAVRHRHAVPRVGAEGLGDELDEAPARDGRVIAFGGLRGEGEDDRGAPDAAVADENGVVLGRASQDLQNVLQLGAAADEGRRIDAGGEGGEVAAVAVEVRSRRLGRRVARSCVRLLGEGSGAGDHERLLLERVQARAEFAHRLRDGGIRVLGDRRQ
jgi:hypothetical protein